MRNGHLFPGTCPIRWFFEYFYYCGQDFNKVISDERVLSVCQLWRFDQNLSGKQLLTGNDNSNPWWELLQNAVNEAGGKTSEPEIFPASTDSRYFRKAGLPAFGFSPVSNTPSLLHDHNEVLSYPSVCLLSGWSVSNALLSPCFLCSIWVKLSIWGALICMSQSLRLTHHILHPEKEGSAIRVRVTTQFSLPHPYVINKNESHCYHVNVSCINLAVVCY